MSITRPASSLTFDVQIQKTLKRGSRQFDLDVTIQTAASRVVLLGPSGAGKSLTLQAVAGLLTPDAGRIAVASTCLFDVAHRHNLAPQARRLGYVFQDFALFPHLTVRQNVAMGLALGWRNPSRKALTPERAAVEDWLARMELSAQADFYPADLSGGQRQRVALARALVGQPRALLLDEPFAALDAPLRQRMRVQLSTLQAELRVPLLLITHDPADAEQLGDAVFTLEQGRVSS